MSPAQAATAGPGGAKEQVGRLLRLVPYLYARGTVRVADAAADLGVSPKVLVQDLKVLFMCGLPGGYPDDLIDVDLDALEGPLPEPPEAGPDPTDHAEPAPEAGAGAGSVAAAAEGDGIIRVSNADYLARPLQLSPTEATAVIVALRALRSGAGEATREIVDRTLAKLEAAVQGQTDPLVDPGTDAVGEREQRFRADLDLAAAQRRQVRLTYYVPSRDEESQRVVDPRGVVNAHGFAYLDAWCHTAEAPRLFRLDRIVEAEVLDAPVSTPVEPPRDLADGIFTRSDDTAPATVRLAPQARWVVEYYPVEAIRELAGGELEVDLLVADERWLLRLLLRLAPHAQVVSPPELRGRAARAATDTLRLYT